MFLECAGMENEIFFSNEHKYLVNCNAMNNMKHN